MFLINLQGKETIYEQIKQQIIKFIDVGVLKANDKLPSVRELASSLGINPNTVLKAYQELESDGYIYTLNKKGNFVAELDNVKKDKDSEAYFYLNKLKESGYKYDDIVDMAKMVFKEEKDAWDKKCIQVF